DEAGQDLAHAPPIAADPDGRAGTRGNEPGAPGDRCELLERPRDRDTQIESCAARRDLRLGGADPVQDAVDELVEESDLRDRLTDRDLAVAVLLADEIEIAAEHRERCAEVVRDDRDELAARALELPQARGGL